MLGHTKDVMLLSELWHMIDKNIFTTPSKPDLFNLYRDEHPEFDQPGAAALRRANLRTYLAQFKKPPRIFILAEAPGPWGCRFSGVPVTSERQFVDADFPINGHRTSLKEDPLAEYTARIYWRVLQYAFPNFLTWNTVPLHPHRIGEPMSIRTPRTREVRAFLPLLRSMLSMLQPEYVLAMGRTAERALSWIDWPSIYVRHPSQGGAKIFEQGVNTVLRRMGLPKAADT